MVDGYLVSGIPGCSQESIAATARQLALLERNDLIFEPLGGTIAYAGRLSMPVPLLSTATQAPGALRGPAGGLGEAVRGGRLAGAARVGSEPSPEVHRTLLDPADHLAGAPPLFAAVGEANYTVIDSVLECFDADASSTAPAPPSSGGASLPSATGTGWGLPSTVGVPQPPAATGDSGGGTPAYVWAIVGTAAGLATLGVAAALLLRQRRGQRQHQTAPKDEESGSGADSSLALPPFDSGRLSSHDGSDLGKLAASTSGASAAACPSTTATAKDLHSSLMLQRCARGLDIVAGLAGRRRGGRARQGAAGALSP